MCSRYEIDARPAALKGRFRIEGDIPDLARDEVRPTDPAPIVVAVPTGTRQVLQARFGLAVTWDDKPLINARAETLLSKPTFRGLLGNRCLVPASAYFEWRRDGTRRHRNRVAPVGEKELMGFAGLYEGDRFVIVTCAPTAAVARVHDRMPAILPPEAEDSWLDAGLEPERLMPLLAPFADLRAVEDVPRQSDLFGG